MERIVTDQEIYNLGFSSRAAYNRRIAAEGKKIERDTQRQANTVDTTRSASRYNPPDDPHMVAAFTKSRLYANQQAANTPVEAPVVAQQETVQRPPKRIDERLARESYQAYMDTAANGTERGKALHNFGISQGVCRSTACGFESNAEVETTVAAIQSEAAAIKYGFDRSGEIAARANASRAVSAISEHATQIVK